MTCPPLRDIECDKRVSVKKPAFVTLAPATLDRLAH